MSLSSATMDRFRHYGQCHGSTPAPRRRHAGQTDCPRRDYALPGSSLVHTPRALVRPARAGPEGLGTLIRSEIQHGVIEPCSRLGSPCVARPAPRRPPSAGLGWRRGNNHAMPALFFLFPRRWTGSCSFPLNKGLLNLATRALASGSRRSPCPDIDVATDRAAGEDAKVPPPDPFPLPRSRSARHVVVRPIDPQGHAFSPGKVSDPRAVSFFLVFPVSESGWLAIQELWQMKALAEHTSNSLLLR